MDRCVAEVGIVAHPLFEQAGECGEHQRAVETQFIEMRQPGLGIASPLRTFDRFAEYLPQRLSVGIAGTVVLLLRPGRRHDFKCRVRDELGDLVVDGDLGAAVDLHVLDRVGVLRREVTGERILRLVHVVVGVEHREVDRPFRHIVRLTAHWDVALKYGRGCILTPSQNPSSSGPKVLVSI